MPNPDKKRLYVREGALHLCSEGSAVEPGEG